MKDKQQFLDTLFKITGSIFFILMIIILIVSAVSPFIY